MTKFKHNTNIKYEGTSWNAVAIRQYKDGTAKTEAQFIQESNDNVHITLSTAQLKELYALATESSEPKAEPVKAKDKGGL